MNNPLPKLVAQLASQFVMRLSILNYHRVLDVHDPMQPAVPNCGDFDREMRWLTNSFNVAPLTEAVQQLRAGRLPARTICITFDDGYRDNLTNALPILESHGVKATFFTTTAYMDGGMMWNDRIIESVRACPKDAKELDLSEFGIGRYAVHQQRHLTVAAIIQDIKYRAFDERESIVMGVFKKFVGENTPRVMMNAEELAAIHASGMEIGGHTHRHPILAQLTTAEAREEIKTNKEMLEAITGDRLLSFAYPNGQPNTDYHEEHVGMLRSLNYEFAVSTSDGTASPQCDPYQLPRFTPWDETPLRYNLRMAKNHFRAPVIAR